MNTSEKAELTASVGHIKRSGILIYNSEVPSMAGRKTTRRTQVIAKRYAFHTKAINDSRLIVVDINLDYLVISDTKLHETFSNLLLSIPLYQFLYHFLQEYFGRSGTHCLGPPYCEIFEIRNTDLQLWSSGHGWQKTNSKKNTGNCKALCFTQT